MNTTLIPSTPTGSSRTNRPARSVSARTLRPILTALALFAAIAGIGLAIALVTGATAVFNILVFALFTVLWLTFAAALAFSPGTLDGLWLQIRRLPLALQAAIWLLFLPLMIALWIWERAWSVPIRLSLIIALGAWNIFMFVPRG